MKINRSVKAISKYRIGGFKHITKSLFFYNRSPELKKSYNNIVSWILLVDDSDDLPKHHVLEISFYRKKARTVSEWSKMWREKSAAKTHEERAKLWKYGHKKHPSLLSVLEENVLDSLNIRKHESWSIVSVIGWTHGISKFRRTILSERTQTTKTKTGRKYANYRR